MLFFDQETGHRFNALTYQPLPMSDTMNYLALPSNLLTVLDTVANLTDDAGRVYRKLTCPQAIATYLWLGHMALALVQQAVVASFWLAVRVYIFAAEIADAQVQDALPQAVEFLATTEELFAQADEELASAFLDADYLPGMWEPSDFDSSDYRIPAQPQSMAAPVAVLTIALSESHEDGLDRLVALEGMTVKQLTPLAEALNIPTRKVRKAALINSILEAEGYKL
jgi:hypothetical protein